MARANSSFTCQSCGAQASKWQGQCLGCGAWNTLVEEAAPPPASGSPRKKTSKLNLVTLDGAEPEPKRLVSGIDELDRVLGGGLVAGSAVLVGGDPGIGKSTIVLQALAALSDHGRPVLYVSGEEAIGQIKMRARRLGLADKPVMLAAETNLGRILSALEGQDLPAVLVIDSIQTLWTDALDSAPGTVSQVRATAQELIRIAKPKGVAVILVGHVTKDGQLAGPRVLEHLVDTVLYFEGERGHQFRILRAVKNRFGPADEIGVFEMTGKGLAEVANPSALFLSDRDQNASGAAVFAGIEGTRPMLVEIQALTAQSVLGTPRRAVVGWDSGRLAMILAVLEARCGVSLAGRDVYLNVAGGMRISEPAADLAVAAALLSSLTDQPLPPNAIVFGEISLSGAIRPVHQAESRIKEAVKLGFTESLAPKGLKLPKGMLEVTGLADLGELVARFDGLTEE